MERQREGRGARIAVQRGRLEIIREVVAWRIRLAVRSPGTRLGQDSERVETSCTGGGLAVEGDHRMHAGCLDHALAPATPQGTSSPLHPPPSPSTRCAAQIWSRQLTSRSTLRLSSVPCRRQLGLRAAALDPGKPKATGVAAYPPRRLSSTTLVDACSPLSRIWLIYAFLLSPIAACAGVCQ